MQQIWSFGLKTIFDDDVICDPCKTGDTACLGENSHFLFSRNRVRAINTDEDDELLMAVITNIVDYTDNATWVDFARIVIADGGSVSFAATIDDGSSLNFPASGTLGATAEIPGPANLALSSIALVALALARHNKEHCSTWLNT